MEMKNMFNPLFYNFFLWPLNEWPSFCDPTYGDPSCDDPTTWEKACLRELSVPPLTYLFSTGPGS